MSLRSASVASAGIEVPSKYSEISDNPFFSCADISLSLSALTGFPDASTITPFDTL